MAKRRVSRRLGVLRYDVTDVVDAVAALCLDAPIAVWTDDVHAIFADPPEAVADVPPDWLVGIYLGAQVRGQIEEDLRAMWRDCAR